MHGTLLYPLPGRLADGKRPFQGAPRIPKLPPDLRKRISTWKRILLTELFRRAGMRIR